MRARFMIFLLFAASAGGCDRADPAPAPAPQEAISVPTPADDPADGEAPPSPARVARRAHVLALLVYRASLEQFPEERFYESLHSKIPEWVRRLGLGDELEPAERDLLNARLGTAKPRDIVNAGWRSEGLCVLAWALGAIEMPHYDKGIEPVEVTAAVGFSEERLAAMDTKPAQDVMARAGLRSRAELARAANLPTLVLWRIRTMQQIPAEQTRKSGFEPDRMDFQAYLRKHPFFKETWLEGIRFAEGDLSIAGAPVGRADPDLVEECRSIALERMIAGSWLQGGCPRYSEVPNDTFLSVLK